MSIPSMSKDKHSCLVCGCESKNYLMCNKCLRIIAHNHALMQIDEEPDKGSRELIAVSRRLYESARFREMLAKDGY